MKYWSFVTMSGWRKPAGASRTNWTIWEGRRSRSRSSATRGARVLSALQQRRYGSRIMAAAMSPCCSREGTGREAEAGEEREHGVRLRGGLEAGERLGAPDGHGDLRCGEAAGCDEVVLDGKRGGGFSFCRGCGEPGDGEEPRVAEWEAEMVHQVEHCRCGRAPAADDRREESTAAARVGSEGRKSRVVERLQGRGSCDRREDGRSGCGGGV